MFINLQTSHMAQSKYTKKVGNENLENKFVQRKENSRKRFHTVYAIKLL